jgi:hypothetical protein
MSVSEAKKHIAKKFPEMKTKRRRSAKSIAIKKKQARQQSPEGK